MDITNTYNRIISEIKNNKRPLINLSTDDINFLIKKWQNKPNKKDLIKILCILEHAKNPNKKLAPLIIETLYKENDSDIIIHTLGISQKHIITRYQLDGERVPIEFINALRELFKRDHPEVLEWNLRLIEQLGKRSILLKNEVLNSKPSFIHLFNSSKKASRDIILLLERRWGK